jgi:endonuclease/exonuclease/phosphatase family metal-dependent hydrolase
MRSSKPRSKIIAGVLMIVIVAITIALVGQVHSTGPAEGTSFIGTSATQPSGPYLRIGTFNIDGGQGLDEKTDLKRTASCMQKLNFIGMNEVHGFMFFNPPNQAIILGQFLNLPYLYVPSERRWGHDSFGNAAFSDLKILHWQRVVLPSEPFHARRNYLLTDAQWNGKTVHFVTTHTDWKTGGEAQFKIVRDVFLNLPTPAVLMGDLNTTIKNPNGLIPDLEKRPGVEEAVSKIIESPPGRLDWIFLRGLTTVDAGEVDLKASDHPAYWAAVKLK